MDRVNISNGDVWKCDAETLDDPKVPLYNKNHISSFIHKQLIYSRAHRKSMRIHRIFEKNH